MNLGEHQTCFLGHLAVLALCGEVIKHKRITRSLYSLLVCSACAYACQRQTAVTDVMLKQSAALTRCLVQLIMYLVSSSRCTVIVNHETILL
jgi:hypothetical protein